MARPTKHGLIAAGLAFLRAVAFVLLLRFAFAPLIKPAMHRLERIPGFASDMAAHRIAAPELFASDILGIVAALVIITLLVLTEGRRLDGWRAEGTLWRRVLRRSLLTDGSVPTGRRFLAGALTGGLLLSAIVGIMAAAGSAHVGWTGQSAAAVLRHQLVFVATFLAVGFVEELTSRGYLLRTLTDALGFWPAALFTSGLFAYAHYAEGDPLVGVIGVLEFAIFSCAAIRATGTLAFSIGFHAAWDYAQSGLFGVPDSSFTFTGALLRTTLSGPVRLTGGIVGPEASLLTLVAIPVVTAVVLWRGWVRARGGEVDTAWRRRVVVPGAVIQG